MCGDGGGDGLEGGEVGELWLTNDVLRNHGISKFMSCYLLPLHLFHHW